MKAGDTVIHTAYGRETKILKVHGPASKLTPNTAECEGFGGHVPLSVLKPKQETANVSKASRSVGGA